MRSLRTISILLAVIMPLLQASERPAFAEEPSKPWRTLYDRCQQLSNEGDYQGALEACEQAHALNPDPGILASIAQIQTVLLHPVQAHEALERYLRSGSLDVADRKTAEGQLRYLETQIATLVVVSRVEGAEIRVDDRVIDTDSLARGIRLQAGAHRVTLQANGLTQRRFVVLRGGERAQIELPGNGSMVLTCAAPGSRFFVDDQEVDAAQARRGVSRVAGSHRVTFRTSATASSEQVVTVAADETSTVVCTTRPVPPSMNPRGYWVTGVGLSLGIAALATAIYNGHEYQRWQDANDSLGRNLTKMTFADSQEQSRENDDLMASIKTRRNVSIGLGIAGSVITAGGVALLFSDSAAAERRAASSWLRRAVAGLSVDGAPSSAEVMWRGAW